MPVSSQQEDVSIPLLSWQEVSLLKGLLGNLFPSSHLFLFPSPVINMAVTLPNRAFFVNSESHVSKRSSRACHSSCPLCLKLPTLDRSAVQPRTAGVCQPYVSFVTFSHFSLGCLQCPLSSWDNQGLPGCVKIIYAAEKAEDEHVSMYMST